MSPARGGKTSATETADLDQQIARVADELYALKPDDFATARDAQVRAARDAGQQPLAREIAKLRKPTQSAWLLNLLWRDQHEVMEQLFQLAHELSQAQAEAAGPALRELTAQRRQIENSLVRRAVELGTQAGVRVSDSVAREAQETLSAALARPDVADEVRSGRLVKPASYVGFGALPTTTPARDRPSPALIDLDAARQRRASATPQEQQEAENEARQRAEAQRRQQRERALATARAAAERAASHLHEASKAAEEAHSRATDVRQQLESLRAQLQRLEGELDSAEARATQADQRKQDAEDENTAAIEAVKSAEKELTE